MASADDAQQRIFAQRAEAAFLKAQSQYAANTNDPVLAWQFARTCYDWADFATNKAQRAAVARAGIAACRQSLQFTNSVAGHYYMAMDLGQLAQAEMLSGLKIVREMAREFTAAADLDLHFDYGGPDRGLGLLYDQAPGWPVSIGNRRKAKEFLQDAIALAPNYPDNVLNLAEAYLQWGDRKNAQIQLGVADAIWPAAQKTFAGPKWERSWQDWSQRRNVLRQKLAAQ